MKETLDELISNVDGKLIIEMNVHNYKSDYWSFSGVSATSSGGRALYNKAGLNTLDELKGAIQDFLSDVYREGKKLPKPKPVKAPKEAEPVDDFLC